METSSFSLPGRVLIIGGWFPPRPGGSPTVLSNLLQWFDPADYIVATGRPAPDEPRSAPIPGAQVHHVSINPPVHRPGHQLLNTLQIPTAAVQTAALARQSDCKAILAVFPDLQYLITAYLVHKITGLPLAAYLHDFIVEAGYGGYLGTLSRWIQPRIFRTAHPLWTMSSAMSEHLQKTYQLNSTPLVHAYNEPIPMEPPTADPNPGDVKLFFSGGVYNANKASLVRIVRAAATLPNARLTLFGNNNPEMLAQQGIAGPHVQLGFISNRAELLAFMQKQEIFVSCLSWPDESWLGENELATIFSTKLPEYLAQGRPILIHCPSHYFIARFCLQNDCGWVVSERSEEALVSALREIQQNPALRERRCRNALKTAQLFAGNRVAQQFQKGMSGILHEN